jgi:predicted PurR-regulated permease PerM
MLISNKLNSHMKIKNLNTYFFLTMFLLVGYFTYQIYAPFITTIFVAAVLAVIFQKSYKRILKLTKKRKALASGLTCLMIFFIIILPLTFVGSLISNEIISISQQITDTDSELYQTIQPALAQLENVPVIQDYIDNPESLLEDDRITSAASQISQTAIKYFTSISQSIASIAGLIVAMFFALFYFFIDGKKAVDKFMEISPLADKHEELLIKKFTSMTRATLKGTVALGLIQGTMGGLAFLITGINSIALWTVVMIALSIIPLVGAPVILFPASLIMFATGNIWQGVFLLIATGLVAGADNVLRPQLVGKDVEMHSLLIFFSTIGGIAAFGILGFIIGPIIMALFLTFIEIYQLEFNDDLKKYNKK